jgi:hypothetical protein
MNVLVSVCCGVAMAHIAPPAVDWASAPTRADETVLLLGGPFAAGTTVSIEPVGGGDDRATWSATVIEPLQVDIPIAIAPCTIPLTRVGMRVLLGVD